MKVLTPIEQSKRDYPTGNLVNILFNGVPCAIVSWYTAMYSFLKTYPILSWDKEVSGENYPADENGYTSLQEQNRCIRHLFTVSKYQYFKRTERKTLKEFTFDGVAIVCCKGHYLSVNGNEYYSFFNNDDDEVIAIWYLKDAKNYEKYTRKGEL